MIKTLYVKPLGVQLKTFQAEVDVIAQNIVNGNLIIKAFPSIFKELEFSEDERCWTIKRESRDFPVINEKSEWKIITKGIKNETVVCPPVSV